MKRLLLFAVVLFFCCSCARKEEAEEVSGRYVEEQVELPRSGVNYSGLVQSGERIRLSDTGGNDLVSADGGISFGEDDRIPSSYAKWREGPHDTVVSPEGDRLFWNAEKENCVLVTANDEEIEIPGLGFFPQLFWSGGYFYAIAEGREVYRLEPSDGEKLFLTESEYPVSCLAAGESYLYLAHADGVLVYDQEKGGFAETQDEVLSRFVAENAGGNAPRRSELHMYPYQDGLWLLSKSGLYWHSLYGEEMELVIDGDTCGIGDLDSGFVGLAVCESGEAAGKPVFLIGYTDGRLMRYTYDASLPTRPDVSLRIYSVYDDGNVRQAVSAFRKQYPDVNVLYETGVKAGYGVTEQDALKNLATEIAAGNGPDVLVMDDIPFEAYLKKGVLMDLSSFWEGMEGEYFENVLEAYRSEEGLYAIPMGFFIPVLGGEKEKIAGVESLSGLAELLEAERSRGTEGSLISFWDAESALRLLSQSSQGAWLREGSLDREAVEEFLVQAKRIYNAQMEDPAVEWDLYLGGLWTGRYTLERRFGRPYGIAEAANHAIVPFSGQPFVAGYMSGAGADYRIFLGELEYMGAAFGYGLMPGQQYGTCLDVSVLAVNAASKNRENAETFLEFALSDRFQGEASLNGTPLNRGAYLGRQVDTRDEPYIRAGLPIGSTNAIDFDGTMVLVDIYWPGEEQFRELDRLLDRVTGVNRCDGFVYEKVIEQGKRALEEACGVDEAVDEIERQVQIYLAE